MRTGAAATYNPVDQRMEPRTIESRNARQHNLKSVSLSLPRNTLIVFTGVSGSGKSSLAFDTLYAEGQRRYIESLSSYARQFMGQMQKPDCDLITGLSPAIAIEQKTSGWNPRSTVGTITGIHDFLRVLYARVGTQHCTSCGRRIEAQSREQIVEGILRAFGGSAAADEERGVGVMVLAPVARGQKGEFHDLFDELIRAGYVRARVDGEIVELRENLALVKNQRHDIEVVIDRLVISPASRARLAEAVEGALRTGKGTLIVAQTPKRRRSAEEDRNAEMFSRDSFSRDSFSRDSQRSASAMSSRDPKGSASTMFSRDSQRSASEKRKRSDETDDIPTNQPSGRDLQETRGTGRGSLDRVFSSKYSCPECGVSFEPPSPQLFSFNSPIGMCMTCDGLGELFDFDPELLVPDPLLDFWAPCVAPLRVRIGRWRRHIYEGVARAVGFDITQPWKDLPAKARDALLYGTGERHITYEWRWSGGSWKHGGTFGGVIEELREKYRKAKASFIREYYEKFMRHGPCPECRGAKLNEQALAVRLGVENAETFSRDPKGSAWDAGGPNIQELCSLSVSDARAVIDHLVLTPVQQIVAEDVLKEIRGRLDFLLNVGLHYLTLERGERTLSGGELQRIRLAGQIGSGLVGVLYILDEPSIGLHARDNEQLLNSLQRLRDMGNTVIVVEHDEATMRAADHIVDFGPGPGVRGGKVVAEGTLEDITKNKESLTAQYLTGVRKIEVPKERRPVVRLSQRAGRCVK